MSVVSVRESWKGRGGDNEYGTARAHVRVFDVIVDSTSDDETTILQDIRIPAPYTPHPTDAGSYAKKGKADNDDKHWSRWKAVIEYSTPDKKDDDDEDNPLDRRAKITIVTQTRQKPMTRARRKQESGEYTEEAIPVVNSAGDPITKLPDVDDSIYHATIEKNLAAAPEWLLDYKNAINSDSFALRGLTIPAGVAYITALGFGDVQKENDIEFFVLRIEMLLDKDGHDVPILDTGFFEFIDPEMEYFKITPPAFKKRIVDAESVPVTEPQLLNGKGRLLQQNEEEVYLYYRPQKEKSFGDLPLA
jgi:hypothetical protein